VKAGSVFHLIYRLSGSIFVALMTLTEKVLARASGRSRVAAGDNVWVNADILLTHDVCGPGSIGMFKRQFGQNVKIWDPAKIVIS
jgi:3-isopropylmalate/(R)-2-methylmalate dehydratase large subunit